MIQLGFGIGGLVAIGLVFIGVRFLVQPRIAARQFGIPGSELAERNPFWLVKGVRDLAWALLIGALVPIGDCAIVLRYRGTRLAAFGIHGATALLLLAGAASLFAAR